MLPRSLSSQRSSNIRCNIRCDELDDEGGHWACRIQHCSKELLCYSPSSHTIQDTGGRKRRGAHQCARSSALSAQEHAEQTVHPVQGSLSYCRRWHAASRAGLSLQAPATAISRCQNFTYTSGGCVLLKTCCGVREATLGRASGREACKAL